MLRGRVHVLTSDVAENLEVAGISPTEKADGHGAGDTGRRPLNVIGGTSGDGRILAGLLEDIEAGDLGRGSCREGQEGSSGELHGDCLEVG